MKQCPTCQSQYTDDTLKFCLQDGSPLQFAADSQGKTISFSEQATLPSNRRSNQINTPPVTNPTNWQPAPFPSNPDIQPQKRSSATVAVFLTVFVMLLLFSFVGIGAWFYFRGATPDDKGNLFLANRAGNTELAKATPLTASTPTTAANTASNAVKPMKTPPVDKEQINRDVAQRVEAWKSAAESLNLDSYMSNYGATVNYYNKKGASQATVRADKQRAFTAYDSMKITITNLSVTSDATGENATAVFDKEWNFSGAQKYSAGKVKQQLQLKKIGGQWLITGERDLQVYYTE